MTRRIPAPRETVFKSWTVPTEIKRWWSPAGFTTPVAEVDLRVGGTYRIGMKSPDGEVLYALGSYREVSPPSKLVFTWAWDEDGAPGHESLVTIEFIERGNATEGSSRTNNSSTPNLATSTPMVGSGASTSWRRSSADQCSADVYHRPADHKSRHYRANGRAMLALL
jgi:uncharacterized protein YndB with AHSA1/START domain